MDTQPLTPRRKRREYDPWSRKVTQPEWRYLYWQRPLTFALVAVGLLLLCEALFILVSLST